MMKEQKDIHNHYIDLVQQYGKVHEANSNRTTANILGVLDESQAREIDKQLALEYLQTNMKLSRQAYMQQPVEGCIVHFHDTPPFAQRGDLSLDNMRAGDPIAKKHTTIGAYMHHLIHTYEIDRIYFYRQTSLRDGVSYGFSPAEIENILQYNM